MPKALGGGSGFSAACAARGRSRGSIHRILRLSGENCLGPKGFWPRTSTGALSLKYLRPFLAIYGTGIVGTFAWLVFALSGSSACASGTQPCRIVVGLTGQLALIWPAYWGGRISGNAAMTPVVSVEVAAIAVLVFLVVLLLAGAYTLLERSDSNPPRDEPLIRTGEPNRRNQSQP